MQCSASNLDAINGYDSQNIYYMPFWDPHPVRNSLYLRSYCTKASESALFTRNSSLFPFQHTFLFSLTIFSHRRIPLPFSESVRCHAHPPHLVIYCGPWWPLTCSYISEALRSPSHLQQLIGALGMSLDVSHLFEPSNRRTYCKSNLPIPFAIDPFVERFKKV